MAAVPVRSVDMEDRCRDARIQPLRSELIERDGGSASSCISGCAIGAYHYWPEEFIDYWFGKHIFRAG